MNTELNKLLALFGLLGFFIAGAVALTLVHRSRGNKATLDQLVTNRYGEMDPVLCAFWLGIGTMAWVLVWCTLKGAVAEGIGAVYSAFGLAVVGPLVSKVVFHAKSPPAVPPEKDA